MATATLPTRAAAPAPAALLLCLLAAVALFATPGAGLRCWVCRSDYDPHCADPFNNASMAVTDCAQVPLPGGGEARFCSKMRSEVNGRTVYFRSCSDNEGLCPNVEHAGLCSTCRRDYCNGAERPGGAGLPLALAAAAAAAALAGAAALRP